MERKLLLKSGPSSISSLHTEDTEKNSGIECEDEESVDLPCATTRIHNLSEATRCLEDVRHFLEQKGHTC